MTNSRVEDILPLSPLQEGLLFQTLLAEQGEDPYISQLLLDLDGELDVVALKLAAKALLRRHANLRAGFHHDGAAEPVAVIHRNVTLPWRQIDLSSVPTARQAEELERLQRSERAQRFDLATPPLLRFAVVRLGPGRYRLSLCKHHLLLDGWSMPILVKELFALYASRGDDSVLPRLTPYKDYLAWLTRQDRQAGEQAWRVALAGLDEPTLIRPDLGEATERPALLASTAPAELTAALQETARANGLTMNTVVQGCWGLLLARLTGRTDVVFGSTVSGRPPELAGVEGMVGLFINTLPIRVRCRPDDSLLTLLTELQAGQTDLMDYQHVRLSEISAATGIKQLFDTVTVFQNYPVDPNAAHLESGGLRISGVAGRDGTHYPLSFAAGLIGPDLHLRLSCRTDAFTETEVHALRDRLLRLFGAVVRDITVPVGTVEDFAPGEREVLLHRNSEPAAEPVTVAELFGNWVAAQPDAVAVVAGEVELSYAELDARSNRLARLLIGRGIGAEDIVALGVSRTVEMLVSLLAVTKAGAAYLPVDPNYPTDRISYMIADAKPKLGLVDASTVAALAVNDLILLEVDASTGSDRSADPITDADRLVPASVRHPAYLIYTSGSTGRPKGVVVTHHGVHSLVSTQRERMLVGPGDRVLQFASPSFDASFWELAMALLSGATFVLAPNDELMPGEPLIELLDRQRISHVCLPPAALAALPSEGGVLAGATILSAGEACSPELVARWSVGRRMLNGYGPTESTVCASLSEPLSGNGIPPIGRPVTGTEVYLLDAGLRPVLPGVAGEVYLAGAGLARGYLNRPDLTATRFVANPYGDGRMYRTGDLARWIEDGELEFVGRADDQVKLRGFRIELGEIESALLTDESVAQAVVIVREDTQGDRRLVGYVITADGASPAEKALRASVGAALPEYMVPAAIVVLDALPLTPNGKIDRKALPAPTLGSVHRTEPSTEAERSLCALFAEVLKVDAVGADESFFDLGGHSLLATKLVSRIRAAMSVELSIRALFESPTPQALAAVLDPTACVRREVTARPRPERIPLSFAQQRLWFLNRFEGPSGTYNVPLGIRLRGELDVAALHEAIADLVTRHEPLRTVFAEQSGGVHQVVLDAATARPELTLVEVAEVNLRRAVETEAIKGFDLAAQPPLRAGLFRVDATEHVLLLVLHHIATDGGSTAPLARDLAEAYTARLAGMAPDWAPLPVQYVDYALWQRDMLGSEDDKDSLISAQLDYWRARLAGLPEAIELPTDRPRPAVASYRGESVPFELDVDTHQRLDAFARTNSASPFMVLQAALAMLLSKLGAGSDIPIGTPIAGRTDAACQDLVGFFVNTLVLRTDTAGDPTLRELLARVREGNLAAYANQDLPFERLVEVLAPARSLARHPLFQVMLTFQNNAEASLPLPGLEVSPYLAARAVSKFDLSLSIAEEFDEASRPAGIAGALRYSSDLFDPGSVEALSGRLARLLTEALAAPDRRMSTVDVLEPGERERILDDWNASTSWQPNPPAIVERFATAVAANADRVALIQGTTRMTYAELDSAADDVAGALIGRGVEVGDVVALAMPRRIELVAAMLGVLKAGGAYLPIDPDYPADRITFMLADAAPKLVLTDLDTAPSIPGGIPIETVEAAAYEPRTPRPGDAAYLIYTSGSTGRPKGVVVEHRALADYLSWTSGAYPDAGGGALLHSSMAFDLTITALYTPLMVGGCVHLAALREDATVSAALREAECTFLKATPSHLSLLTALPEEFSPSGTLLLGGEGLTGEALAAWRQQHPDVRVINVYGPTEASVNCTQYELPPGEVPAGPVPIGRPFPGTQAYVLDAALNPVPPGVVGELYIAGASLARGYLNCPDLTATRFVACPYGSGGRMYWTGDLARWNSAGQLVYAGRADDQVKLRGFRIELGEITSVLAGAPGVREAAAIVREDRAGDKRLVGYLVGAADHAEVLAHAATRLPGYMVPAAVVTLPALPLNAHGKLDRKALPAPEITGSEAGRAPRDERERVLVELFAEVLGAESVGIDDNFFDLGGHSLLTTKLAALVKDRLGVELTIRGLFEAPTVAQLAPQLGTDTLDGALDVLLPLRPYGSRPPLFCVHPGLGISWVYSGLVRELEADRPIYALQARGLNGSDGLPQTMAEMAKDYLEQIRAIQPTGPYHLLGWSFGGVVAHAMATELQAGGEEVALLALLDAYPGGGRHGEVALSQQDFLAGLLGIIGRDGEQQENLDHQKVAELFSASDGAMRGVQARHIAGIERVARNNGRLSDDYRPAVFHGDVLYFLATDKPAGAPSERIWECFVDGHLAVHPLACAHDDLTRPGVIETIGTVLTDVLART